MFTYTQVETETVAACAYANGLIKTGATQLECNAKDNYQVKKIAKAVNYLRSFHPRRANETVVTANYTYLFARKYIGKYSVGNCEELAMAALGYFVDSKSTIRAEMFQIINGDHAFLVVNREIKSDPNRPETWGEHCFICDPWSKKVYPAKNYATELKNFSQFLQKGRWINQTQPLTKDHVLGPCNYYNNDSIKIDYSLKIVAELEINKNRTIMDVVAKHFARLSKLHSNLVQRQGLDRSKVVIIQQKMFELQNLNDKLLQLNEKIYACKKSKTDITSLLKNHRANTNYQRILLFSREQKIQLSKSVSKNMLHYFYLSFFGYKSKVCDKLNRHEDSLRRDWRKASQTSVKVSRAKPKRSY